MTTLIAILISLLGYGTPADFESYTEEQLEGEIQNLEDGGTFGDWDVPSAAEEDGGTFGDWDVPS